MMADKGNSIRLFEEKEVRAIWDDEAEKWWFSVLDIVGILTDQPDYTKVRNYWKWLKKKLGDEGSQLVSITTQLKMLAAKAAREQIELGTGKSAVSLLNAQNLGQMSLDLEVKGD